MTLKHLAEHGIAPKVINGINGYLAGLRPSTPFSVEKNGDLIAAGAFTVAGGVAALRIARWNGVGFAPLGSGLSATANALARDVNGDILVGGQFLTAGGIALPDRAARWTGSTWVPLDVDLPSAATVTAITVAPDGTIVLGYNTTGSAIAGVNTPLVNKSTVGVYPTLTLQGPSSGTSRIYQLINTTTGAAIYFNYTISAGETAILTLDPTNVTFVSSFQGNILNTILPGSDTTAFVLQPGANTIAFFSAASSVSATLDWQIGYANLNDALYQAAAP